MVVWINLLTSVKFEYDCPFYSSGYSWKRYGPIPLHIEKFILDWQRVLNCIDYLEFFFSLGWKSSNIHK